MDASELARKMLERQEKNTEKYFIPSSGTSVSVKLLGRGV